MPSGEDTLDDGRKPQIHEAKHDRHDGNKAQNRKRRFARFLERRPRNLTQFAARIFDILRQAGDGVGGRNVGSAGPLCLSLWISALGTQLYHKALGLFAPQIQK